MQAVILAAGKSTRMYPLTLTRPKPMLPVLDSTLLAHNLFQLRGLAEEVLVIVNYKKEQFSVPSYLPVTFIEQNEVNGTGAALNAARPYLKDRFIVLNGDDLYNRDDLKRLIKNRYAILVSRVKNPERYGVIASKGDLVTALIEKPSQPPSDLANTGAYVLDTAIFQNKLEPSPRGEYEIIDYLHSLINRNKLHFESIREYWLPVGYPWQLLEVQEFFVNRMKPSIQGKVEKRATLKGLVRVGANTTIKSGAYIEGPVYIGSGCTIGPNCYIRKGTVIQDNVKVGNACEIKNSLLFSGASVGHLSYIGDSIIGTNVNIGAGTITANLRHDNKEIKMQVNGSVCSTGRRKFGAIIADDVKTGIGTMLYPGIAIDPGQWTRPNEVI
ncbi:MAG: bifunctional sugar-1-phosphate nucleotidylyltransferase/acetyltransferase [Candidatus Woesearchaeota archaeon]